MSQTPDEWWDAQPHERKASIHRWLTQGSGGFATHPSTPGQRAMFHLEDDHKGASDDRAKGVPAVRDRDRAPRRRR